MPLRFLPSILLICTVISPIFARTCADARTPGVTDLDSAARQVLSPVPQESREAMNWLVRHGDRGSLSSFSSRVVA
jgi:hypothetical protein